jgi:hypothetical protein
VTALARTPGDVALAEAAADLAELGVAGEPVWTVRIEDSGAVRVVPGLAVAGASYTTEERVILDAALRAEWTAIVATLATGARA